MHFWLCKESEVQVEREKGCAIDFFNKQTVVKLNR